MESNIVLIQTRVRQCLASASCVALSVLVGCNSGPEAVGVPGFKPSASASKAMEMYDADGDGFIAGEELENAPSLSAAIKTVDSNGDGKIDEDEISARIQDWIDKQTGLMSFECTVILDGNPLPDAQVTMMPEDFMLGAITDGVGVTDMFGQARPKVPKEKRPRPDAPPGMQAGLYLVKISKVVGGNETIPARYNTETTLGQQVAKDDARIASKRVIFKLESK